MLPLKLTKFLVRSHSLPLASSLLSLLTLTNFTHQSKAEDIDKTIIKKPLTISKFSDESNNQEKQQFFKQFEYYFNFE